MGSGHHGRWPRIGDRRAERHVGRDLEAGDRYSGRCDGRQGCKCSDHADRRAGHGSHAVSSSGWGASGHIDLMALRHPGPHSRYAIAKWRLPLALAAPSFLVRGAAPNYRMVPHHEGLERHPQRRPSESRAALPLQRAILLRRCPRAAPDHPLHQPVQRTGPLESRARGNPLSRGGRVRAAALPR